MSLPRLSASLIAAAALLLAVAPAHAKDTKIGVVDTQQILSELADGKAAQKRLERWMDAKKKELEKEDQALMKESELLQKQSSAMNQETLMKKQGELQRKGMEFAKKVQEMQAEAQKKEMDEVRPILTRINTVVGKIAQREGLTIVLEKRGSGLVFLDNSHDYTAKVISQYNADYKSGASAKGGK
jgi:outer membrane protein